MPMIRGWLEKFEASHHAPHTHGFRGDCSYCAAPKPAIFEFCFLRGTKTVRQAVCATHALRVALRHNLDLPVLRDPKEVGIEYAAMLHSKLDELQVPVHVDGSGGLYRGMTFLHLATELGMNPFETMAEMCGFRALASLSWRVKDVAEGAARLAWKAAEKAFDATTAKMQAVTPKPPPWQVWGLTEEQWKEMRAREATEWDAYCREVLYAKKDPS